MQGGGEGVPSFSPFLPCVRCVCVFCAGEERRGRRRASVCGASNGEKSEEEVVGFFECVCVCVCV